MLKSCCVLFSSLCVLCTCPVEELPALVQMWMQASITNIAHKVSYHKVESRYEHLNIKQHVINHDHGQLIFFFNHNTKA